MVAGLVQQQQVRIGEQHPGQRDAHAKPAGQRRARSRLCRLWEAQPGQDGGGASRRPMGVHVGETGVDLADVVRVGLRLGFRQQPGAFPIGGEHRLQQAFRPPRRLLGHDRDAGPGRNADMARIRLQLSGDEAQKGGLAGAVAPHQPDLGASRHRQPGALHQGPPADPAGQVVDPQHGTVISLLASNSSLGTPRPRLYMLPSSYWAAAWNLSAAARYHRTASANFGFRPLRVRPDGRV